MSPSKLAAGAVTVVLASLGPFLAWVTDQGGDRWRARTEILTLAMWGVAAGILILSAAWGYTIRRRLRRSGADVSGIWHSSYRYKPSGSRQWVSSGEHYLVLKRRGKHVTAKSRPTPAGSSVEMDLRYSRDTVLTGTWSEKTAKSGRHKGAIYYGAIQFVIEGGGRRMNGRWVGFDSDYGVNSGPWELEKCEDTTHLLSRRRYDRRA